jgi:hypothetical protein
MYTFTSLNVDTVAMRSKEFNRNGVGLDLRMDPTFVILEVSLISFG